MTKPISYEQYWRYMTLPRGQLALPLTGVTVFHVTADMMRQLQQDADPGPQPVWTLNHTARDARTGRAALRPCSGRDASQACVSGLPAYLDCISEREIVNGH